MKINLPVHKLLYPALAAAALLSAAGGLFAVTFQNYDECRCAPGPGPNDGSTKYSWDYCCGVTAYVADYAQKTNCCNNSAAFKSNAANGCTVDCSGYKCTTGIGGWVKYDSTDYTNCTNCCGTGYTMSLNTSTIVTCGGNQYIQCSCSKTTTPPSGTHTPTWNFWGHNPIGCTPSNASTCATSMAFSMTNNSNVQDCPPCMGGVAGMGNASYPYNLKSANACIGLGGCMGAVSGVCKIWQQNGSTYCGGPNDPCYMDMWLLTCS